MAYGNGDSITGGAGVYAQPGTITYVPGNGPSIGDFKAQVPTRTPATQVETERLNKAVEVLHLLLGELETRLADVMIPEGPNNIAGPKVEQRSQSSVALARHLGQLADRVEQATTRVTSLMGRIEV